LFGCDHAGPKAGMGAGSAVDLRDQCQDVDRSTIPSHWPQVSCC